MRNFFLVFCLLLAGCAHCSVTETVFNGKTKGFNPYGDGDAEVKRVSYWGTSKALVRKLMDSKISK